MHKYAGVYLYESSPESLDSWACKLAATLLANGGHGCSAIFLPQSVFVYRDDRYTSLAGIATVEANGLPYVAYWDGRLDNRDSVRPRVAIGSGSKVSDSEIALQAYIKWGLSSFEKLIGDWSFAIADPILNQLVLSRDFSGIRPLYYRHHERFFLWSSELETFLQTYDGERSWSLNRDYLSAFIASRPPLDETAFADVRAVPPGHCVVAHSQQLVTHRNWSINTESELRYPRQSDYEEHFIELWRRAVRDRLRIGGKVWSELSGGLDTSSIVCIAGDMLRTENAEQDFNTISYVAGNGVPGDEQSYIELVELQMKQHGHHLMENDYSLLFPKTNRFLSSPVANAGRYAAALELLEANNVDTLLRGHGGDAVMWSTTDRVPVLADLLSHGRVNKLHTLTREFASAHGRSYWNLLWREGLAPLLFDGALGQMLPMQWLNSITDCAFRPSSIKESKPTGLSWCSYTHTKLITDAIAICSFQYLRTCGEVVPAYPFLDRRIIQFMLSIPFDQKFRPGNTRSLQRRALSGALPQEIEARATKASGEGSIYRAINRDWKRLAMLLNGRSRIVENGYVDYPSLQEGLDRARRGLSANGLRLLRMIAVEYWWENIEINRPTFLPVRPRQRFVLSVSRTGESMKVKS